VCNEAKAGIVVVSAWRRVFSRKELDCHLLSCGVLGPLVDVIPWHRKHDDRALGARRWLKAHPKVTRWAVVDDDQEHMWGLFEEFKSCWVKPVDGLTEADAKRLLELLRGW
jgi:hypothetical protein